MTETTTPATIQNKTIVFDASQKEIARQIARLITKGSQSATIREFTTSLLRDSNIPLYPPSVQQLDTIYNFVARKVDFLKDIARVETLHTAETVLKNLYGDCDDKVILGGAMLKTLGYTLAIVYLDFLGGGMDYQHVYLYVVHNNRYIPFDAAINEGSLGDEAKGYKYKRIMVIY